jgi:hypothetical protein
LWFAVLKIIILHTHIQIADILSAQDNFICFK